MTSFNIVHHDGVVRVELASSSCSLWDMGLDDNGHATVTIDNINDSEIVGRAINRALQEGAQSGTLYTGDVVNHQLASMHLMRSQTGKTWLGGKVTRLTDGADGPRFRIDWETFPQITE